MEDIREILLTKIEEGMNEEGMKYKLGDVVMSHDSAFEIKDRDGFKVKVTEFIPAMPRYIKGTMVPVDGLTLFKYDIIIEFFVKEKFIKAFKKNSAKVIKSNFIRNKIKLFDDVEAMYNAGEAIHDRSEVFNKDKVAIFSIPFSILVGENLNFSSDTRVFLKYGGSYIPLPVYGGSVSVSGSSSSAQRIAEGKTTSVNTTRSWSCTAELYYVKEDTMDELFNFVKTASNQNTVFDLKIEYSNNQIDERKVIITSITTPLLAEQVRTFVVTFTEADEVLYNGNS